MNSKTKKILAVACVILLIVGIGTVAAGKIDVVKRIAVDTGAAIVIDKAIDGAQEVYDAACEKIDKNKDVAYQMCENCGINPEYKMPLAAVVQG